MGCHIDWTVFVTVGVRAVAGVSIARVAGVGEWTVADAVVEALVA
jgi:hypothetical protein